MNSVDKQSKIPALSIQDKMSKVVPQEDDKNCQVNMRPVKSTVCYDKKCQETQDVHIRSVTKSTYIQVTKPASLQSACKQKNPRRQ